MSPERDVDVVTSFTVSRAASIILSEARYPDKVSKIRQNCGGPWLSAASMLRGHCVQTTILSWLSGQMLSVLTEHVVALGLSHVDIASGY